jgi:hypothetical protein
MIVEKGVIMSQVNPKIASDYLHLQFSFHGHFVVAACSRRIPPAFSFFVVCVFLAIGFPGFHTQTVLRTSNS